METRPAYELRVGAVVLAALVIIIFSYYFATYYGKSLRNNFYTIAFHDVAGLREGGEVRLSGKMIGMVDKMELQPDGRVLVQIAVGKRYVLRKNYEFTIRQGLLGGQVFVDIKWAADGGPRLMPGETVEGKEPATASGILPQARRVLEEAGEALSSVNRAVNNPELRVALENALNGLAESSQDLRQLASSLSEVTRSSGGQLELIGEDLRLTAQSLRKSASSVESLISDPELQRRIKEILSSLEGAVTNIQNLVQQPELALALENLAATSSSLRAVSREVEQAFEEGKGAANLSQALESVKSAATKIETIAEHLEKLVISERLGERVSSAVSDIEETAKIAKATAKEVGEITSHTGSFLNTINRLSATARQDLYFLEGPDSFRSDIELELGSKGSKNSVILGFQEVGESNKLKLKYAFPGGNNTRLLAGIHRSKVGIGIETKAARNLQFSFDLYDPDELKGDFWVRYWLGKEVSLAAGMQEAFRENHPRLGISLEK